MPITVVLCAGVDFLKDEQLRVAESNSVIKIWTGSSQTTVSAHAQQNMAVNNQNIFKSLQEFFVEYILSNSVLHKVVQQGDLKRQKVKVFISISQLRDVTHHMGLRSVPATRHKSRLNPN